MHDDIKKQTNAQIITAAGSLKALLSSTVPLKDALRTLGRLQPEYRSFWFACADRASSGTTLSVMLAPIWPIEIVELVKAGERSGKVPEIMAKIGSAIKIQQQISGVAKRMIKPTVLLLGGIGTFLFFMGFVVPEIYKSVGSNKNNLKDGALFQLTQIIEPLVKGYWWACLAVVAAIAVYVFRWFTVPGNSGRFVSAFSFIPAGKNGLSLIYHAGFAASLSMLYSAGLQNHISDKIRQAAQAIPPRFQAGVLKVADTIKYAAMDKSVDLDSFPPDDPRHELPMFLVQAFITSTRTTSLDEQLMQTVPDMLELGFSQVETMFTVINNIATGLVALFMTIPLLAYFGAIQEVLGSIK